MRRIQLSGVPDRDRVTAIGYLQKQATRYISGRLCLQPILIWVYTVKTYKFMVLACPVGPYFAKAIKVKIETHYTRAAEGGMGYANHPVITGALCCRLKRRPKKVLTN